MTSSSLEIYFISICGIQNCYINESFHLLHPKGILIKCIIFDCLLEIILLDHELLKDTLIILQNPCDTLQNVNTVINKVVEFQ